MARLRDAIAHGVMGAIGLLSGILSAVALAVAAAIPPVIALLALILSPIRALLGLLRRGRPTA